MAMTKPTGFNVPSFDANSPYLFKFETSGGNQVIKNKLIIKNNETNIIVYDKIVENYRFEHELPKNTLQNNKYYNYSIITYDINDSPSQPSNPIQFYCYSKPIVQIVNMPIDNIIESPNYKFIGEYKQSEGELLNTFKFNLYDASGMLISSSNNLYNPNVPPLRFEFETDGLLDDYDYKISCIAITINGNIVESELIQFGVNYYNPKFFSLFDIANNCGEGYVEIKNNMKIIDGHCYPDPPTYIDDTKIYLKDEGYYVKWIDGYVIKRDFMIGIWFEQPNVGEEFKMVALWNDKDTENTPYKITINLIKDYEYGIYEDRTCAELRCYSGNKLDYYICSNFIRNIKPNERLFLYAKRIGNIYFISLEKLFETDEIYWNEEVTDNVVWGKELSEVYWN